MAAPIITSQPKDVTVNDGETATFSVTASGVGPLVYQWFYNGVRICGAFAYTTYSFQVNATNNGGHVSVKVTDEFGSSVTSRHALIKITGCP
jgi:hypothetical protein